MKFLFILSTICLLSTTANAFESLSKTVEVRGDVPQVVEKIKRFLVSKKIRVMETISHSESASKVGQKLEDNILLIFGNPKVGSKLMVENPEIGFYLPMRAQVYRKNGKSWVSVSNPEFIRSNYKLKSKENLMLLAKVSKLLDALTKKAGGK